MPACKPDLLLAERKYAEFMRCYGIDLKSPHAHETPRRVARMFAEFTQGLRDCPFKFTAFPKDKRHTYDQLIILESIPFYSVCAHHHVPFIGSIAVGYLPKQKVVGLSKIVRLVQWISRKPSIQEDLTEQVADTLMRNLDPKAVLVLVSAEHLCISMRGIQQPGVRTKTHCIRGAVSDSLKQEFLQLVGAR